MIFKRSQHGAQGGKDAGTVIGNGIVLENITLKGLGVIRVDGIITGDIQLEGHLILGETGKIIGEVHASSAMFFGSYEGNLYIDDTLHIASSGRIEGHIKAGKLIVDEGADIQGTCNLDEVKLDKYNKILSFRKEKDFLPPVEESSL